MEGVSPDLTVDYILEDDLDQPEDTQTTWELKRLSLEEQAKLEKLQEESTRRMQRGQVEVDHKLRMRWYLATFRAGIKRIRNWKFSDANPKLREKGWHDIDCETDDWALKVVLNELPTKYITELIVKIDEIGNLSPEGKKKGRGRDVAPDVAVRPSGSGNGEVQLPDVQRDPKKRKDAVGADG